MSFETATTAVRKRDDTLVRMRDVPPDTLVFLEDGQAVGTLLGVLKLLYDANFPTVAETAGLADITENTDGLHFVLGYREPVIQVDGEDNRLCLRWEESNPQELHTIQEVEFRGRASVHVCEVPLHHKRLGVVTYAYGEGKLGDRPLLLVVSEGQGGGKASIRLRPGPEPG